MGKEWYERLAAPFRGNKRRTAALKYTNRIITYGMYALYIVYSNYLAFSRRWYAFWVVMLTAGLGFAAVTLWRHLVNVPRRFEVWEDEPLLGRHREGHSFPSRHVFSAAIIALSVGWLYPWLGVAVGVLALVLAAVRVIGGVHYLRDVLVGIAFALLVGGIGFWLVPHLFF